MATVLEAPRKKALRGVVREISSGYATSLICAEIEGEGIAVESEVPTSELQLLDIRVGDSVDLFPVDIDSYLIVGKTGF